MVSLFRQVRLTIAVFGALAVLSSSMSTSALAALVQFRLQGTGGLGLLGTNENPSRAGGSGGIVGSGIVYDDVTRNISIEVGWGSGKGFTDLTGVATLFHIHGVTPSTAPASFTENVGVLIDLHTLAGFNGSATNGGFVGTVNIPVANVANLFDGRLYLNAHTATFGAGEIRGNLIAVPEPSSMALLGLVSLAGVARARWHRKKSS